MISRTGDLNAFSSLDTSNLIDNAKIIKKTTSNLNKRIVTVTNEPNNAEKLA